MTSEATAQGTEGTVGQAADSDTHTASSAQPRKIIDKAGMEDKERKERQENNTRGRLWLQNTFWHELPP